MAFVALLLLVTGLVIFTKRPVFGIFQAAFGLALYSYSTETWIDIRRRKFKIVTSVFFIPFGSWEDFPKEKFLLLNKLSDSANLSSIDGDFTARVFYYKIFLKSPEISLELVGERDEEKAIAKAKDLAEKLGVELKMNMGKK